MLTALAVAALLVLAFATGWFGAAYADRRSNRRRP